ncbi:glycosyltransferase family 2 protein [Pseudomonas sp. Irchel s3f10]|uniref:glycosyltransferase family 2 protein n=1 Tax=Pseudomonas sp. Irchel s3f10 TaxID=2009137 RepID=UPI002114BD11|nr:glycosyltransferase family 2 protein [Pseudomonas sp. Irchel s3f10]
MISGSSLCFFNKNREGIEHAPPEKCVAPWKNGLHTVTDSFLRKESNAVTVGNETIGTVAILLCTYQGERYLAEQIDSIISQTYDNWVIYASDDGSQDRTLEILRSFQKKLGTERLFIFSGPQQGYANNFVSLVKNQNIVADYYAFCDQDDIWSADKLCVAIQWLKRNTTDIPSLYCGRTALVNESGVKIGHSPLFKYPPSFKNALVQSLAGGNTMVFNHALKKIASVTVNSEIISHDWWFYILATACGGQVFYDFESHVSYRQHSDNVIGANAGVISGLSRLKKMLGGRLLEWNRRNLKAVELLKGRMPPANLIVLENFERARCSPLLRRCVFLMRSGVYRQTLKGNLALWIAVFLNRI